ncbi:50S ribosomal protein L25/general stress protein Ctc [Aureibacillus halotolerans]|uniref:Large ribosomal subunit protein bL25 n=1 Tax=Aureibacillus halotolerans TaxID=1508390 RepID=A0A4V3D4A7_9BACI|nr:50S ribosomal protein L25/general stress protein Ctc [Aureibacillus halotolerans]TDQ34228.1 LSU ribosomal protein L25P [Aureibacillus halotolerans]
MAHTLHAKPRQADKQSSLTSLRSKGYFPAIVYGYKTENTSVAVEYAEFVKTMRDAGRTGVLDLSIDGGKKVQVMLHDIQTDPLKDRVIHADFIAVNMNADVEVDVTVSIEGDSVGVKEGGVAQHIEHTLLVRAKPADLPEQITVDISELNIGDSLSVGDIKTSGAFEVLTDAEATIVTIQPPTVEEEPEDATEDAADEEAASEGSETENKED